MGDLDQLLRNADAASDEAGPARAPGKKPLTLGLQRSGAGSARGEPVEGGAQDRIERSLGVELTRPGGPPGDEGGDRSGGLAYLARGGGAPLPTGAATALSSSYGADLSSVRVHDDATSDRAARGLNAQAFAVGEHVHLSRDVDLASEHGSFVLAHEVAHVVQNRGGDPTMQAFAPGDEHDAAPAERAADEAAEAALRGERVSIAPNPGGIRCFGAGTVKKLKKADANGNHFTVDEGGHAYLTTQALQEMGLSADESVMGYQGNWMRDLSQANVPGLTDLVGAANLNAILQVLSIKEFGRGFDPKEFGTYDPVEHIDNPTDLRASDVYKQTEGAATPGPINPDTTIPIAKVDVSGQDNKAVSGSEHEGYAKDGVDPRYQETAARMQSNGEQMVNTEDQTAFQISNLGMPVYINTSKEWAKATLEKSAMLGKKNPLGPREFGSGIHAVQDYYAHSNFCEIAINVMIKEGKLILPDAAGGKGQAVDKSMRLDSHVHANDKDGEKGVSSVNLKVKDLPGYDAKKMGQGGKGDREVLATGSFNLTDTAVSLLHVLKEKVLSVNPFKEKGKGPSELTNACLDYMDMTTPDRFNKTGQKIADMITPLGSALEALGGVGADAIDAAGQGANKVLDGANAINEFFGGSANYWDKEKKAVSGATSDQAAKLREASQWITKKAAEIAGKQHILRDLYGWWSGIDLLAPLKAIARNIPVIGPKAVELIEKAEKKIRDFIQEELSDGWVAATGKIISALQGIIDKLTKETNVKNKKTAGKDPAALGPDASWTEKLAHQIEEKKAKLARMLGGVGDMYDDQGNPQGGIAPQSYTPPSHSEVAKDHHDKEQAGGAEEHDHHDDEDGDAHQHGGDWLNGLAENLAGKCSKAVGAKVKAVWDIVDGDGGVMVGPETALPAVSAEVDAWMCHPEDCRDKWSGEVSKLMSNPEFAQAILAKLKKQTT